MEKEGKVEGRSLVLVTPPFQGHITPTLQLGTILHSKGFSITIFHAKINAPDPSKYQNLEFRAYGENLPEFNWGGGIIQFNSAMNTACRDELAEYLVEINDEDNRVACIIYDMLMFSAEAVACEMKIPSIAFRTSSASYLIAFRSFYWLKEEGYIPLQEYSILQDLVPGLEPLRFKDLPFGHLSTEDTIELLARTGDIRSSSAIIWNTVDYLEKSSLSKLQQQHYKVAFFPVGPFHIMGKQSSTSILKDDDACIDWLNKQAIGSVIYISLGTVATIDEKELVEMAWGLANSEQPFLWVVRSGSVRGSEWTELLPEGFLEKVGVRGKIVKWAPQKEVLAHHAVGGFFSHCGWNSTLESIYEGVPMICKPCFLDQKVNARYVSYVWRLGFELESVLERHEIERVVRKLMVENEGKELRRRANDLKEKIEDSAREGGSSYTSLNELKDFILSFE